MRRTPDFFSDGDPIANVVFRRPDGLVGDYLENHRILRVLHDRLHFPELEGVIDDAEGLDSFYVFDGTRFIKDRVVGLFDGSEYSFSNMLGHLGDAALRNFAFPVGEFSYGERFELRRGFLLNYEGSFEFNYFSELVALIDAEGHLGSNENLSLFSYRSDRVSSFWPTLLSDCLPNLFSVRDAWNLYVDSDDLRKMMKKRLFDFSGDRRLLRNNVSGIEKSMEPFNRLSRKFYISPYMMKLSACLNLPDDKHAKSGEKILIERWLELFDKFYPEYEKLKAWYIGEKESGKLA